MYLQSEGVAVHVDSTVVYIMTDIYLNTHPKINSKHSTSPLSILHKLTEYQKDILTISGIIYRTISNRNSTTYRYRVFYLQTYIRTYLSFLYFVTSENLIFMNIILILLLVGWVLRRYWP
jgi:hypothetical protein